LGTRPPYESRTSTIAKHPLELPDTKYSVAELLATVTSMLSVCPTTAGSGRIEAATASPTRVSTGEWQPSKRAAADRQRADEEVIY
jgi:hypothetical protein